MTKLAWRWAVLGVAACIGCGHELEVPSPPTTSSGDNSAAGRSSGFTGGADGGDVAELMGAGRLPVPADVGPAFGGAGDGAGGDGGAERGGAAAGGRGGATVGRGGNTSPSDGGEGGAGVGGVASLPAASRLLFSEYVEGAGRAKALEIYAFEASSLDGCELETYFNGNLEPSRLALHGELAAGETHVLCSSDLADQRPDLCTRGTNLSFNGDDALALRCGGKVLDVIGQIGVDPGSAWGDGMTADHSLRRRCDVSGGRTDGSTPFEPNSEWTSSEPDDVADLGKRDCG